MPTALRSVATESSTTTKQRSGRSFGALVASSTCWGFRSAGVTTHAVENERVAGLPARHSAVASARRVAPISPMSSISSPAGTRRSTRDRRHSANHSRIITARAGSTRSPRPRQPGARIDLQVLELAVALKRENPDRTAAQVARILQASGGWAPSESTLLRLFHRRDLMGPADAGTPVFGRFEAADPNERWVGDALHGPKIGGRKTYLFAFLDDHTRLVTGYRFGFAEDTARLAVALHPALAARGVPQTVYVDNGSAFVDSWLLRACGKLGIRLVHATPHRPQGKGKIERFLRTVREQFLVEVADSTAADLVERGPTHAVALLEFNALFTAWVESVYHHQVHSETGQTPLTRWQDGLAAARALARSWHRPTRSPRRSSGPNSGSSPRPRRCRCTATPTRSIRRSSAGGSSWCSPRSTSSPSRCATATTATDARCRSRSPATHTRKPARKPPRPRPAPATGIAYLQLVADAHHQQIAADERIGFHALYSTRTPPPTTPPPRRRPPRRRAAAGAAVHRRRAHRATRASRRRRPRRR